MREVRLCCVSFNPFSYMRGATRIPGMDCRSGLAAMVIYRTFSPLGLVPRVGQLLRLSVARASVVRGVFSARVRRAVRDSASSAGVRGERARPHVFLPACVYWSGLFRFYLYVSPMHIIGGTPHTYVACRGEWKLQTVYV